MKFRKEEGRGRIPVPQTKRLNYQGKEQGQGGSGDGGRATQTGPKVERRRLWGWFRKSRSLVPPKRTKRTGPRTISLTLTWGTISLRSTWPRFLVTDPSTEEVLSPLPFTYVLYSFTGLCPTLKVTVEREVFAPLRQVGGHGGSPESEETRWQDGLYLISNRSIYW